MRRGMILGGVGLLLSACAAPGQTVIKETAGGTNPDGFLGSGVGRYLDPQAEALAEVAEVQRTEDTLIVSLTEGFLFDSGSETLNPGASERVNKIGDIIKAYSEDRVVVVAHTDNRGSRSYNKQLSERRAQTVRLHMVGRGVPSAHIEAVGEGESQPLVSNLTEEGRGKNRRIEIRISVIQTAHP